MDEDQNGPKDSSNQGDIDERDLKDDGQDEANDNQFSYDDERIETVANETNGDKSNADEQQNNGEEDEEDEDDDDEGGLVNVVISGIMKPFSANAPGAPQLNRQKSKTGQLNAPSSTSLVPNQTVINTVGGSAAGAKPTVQTKGVDLEAPGMINDQPTYDFDLQEVKDEDKPWRKPGADITDYFNYGFTEETWIAYCLKQKRLRAENSTFKVLIFSLIIH